MWLLFAFVAVPMIEIALFIQVGGVIGLWPTLAIVLLTAMAGSYLVRSQGARELGRLRQSFSELSDPTEPLANGAMILFAGALLLTPGFFTDACGLALLVPGVRHAVYRWLRARVAVASFQMGGAQRPTYGGTTIDGEFQELNDDLPNQPRGPSGWTRDQ
jgi:UPF0716 protein FxsA